MFGFAAGGDLDTDLYFDIYRNMKKTAVLDALAALAQENRLDLYRRLVTAGPEGLSAGRIAEALGLPAPTLSFHLAQLRHAGLVARRREGRSLIYSANFAAMNGVIGYLTETCCGGRPELCLPERAASRRRGDAR